MVNEIDLEKYKNNVQNIIDKYLPEDKRFSVMDFSEEWLYCITSLFLEKDPEGRRKILIEIGVKKAEAEERLKQAEYNFLELNNEILMKKEEYDKIFNTIDDLNLLVENINLDKELNSNLDVL